MGCQLLNEQVNTSRSDFDGGTQIRKVQRSFATDNAFVASFIMTAQGMELIQKVLHPESSGQAIEGLTNEDTILKQPSNIKERQHRRCTGEDATRQMIKDLNVTTELLKDKPRDKLLKKLIEAVEADLIAYDNEQAATMERRCGYWRFASKRTYNWMVRYNIVWDWCVGTSCRVDLEHQSANKDHQGDGGKAT